MLKKFTIILLSTLLLSACQLANPDQSSSHGDRFMGFYVTPHEFEK